MIAKAEILLVRDRCNLKCSYCNIVRENEHTMSIELWQKGIDNLKQLGVCFLPIYGSEPLLELAVLREFLSYCREVNMSNSVISNCMLMNEKNANDLVESGLESLTVSVDSLKNCHMDKSTELRTKKSLVTLDYLQREHKLRDLEVSVTINRLNLEELPDLIEFFNSKGIWTSFDVIHYDREQEGSKCPPLEKITNHAFSVSHPNDLTRIRNVFKKVIEMKDDGYLIHQTRDILEMWLEGYALHLGWKCGVETGEIGWLTILANGDVTICDDYTPYSLNGFKVYNLVEQWKNFTNILKFIRTRMNCRCFWSTHIQSERMLNNPKMPEYFSHKITKC